MEEPDRPLLDSVEAIEKTGGDAAPYERGRVLQITAGDTAPAQARTLLTNFATGFPKQVVDRARLAISELVTNAVRHGSNPESDLELKLWRGPEVLAFEVIDKGKSYPAERDLGGGFGLEIVARVADSFRSVRADAWHATAEFRSH